MSSSAHTVWTGVELDDPTLIRPDEVTVTEYTDTQAQEVAWGIQCDDHGELYGGNWTNNFPDARRVASLHLVQQHRISPVEALDTVIFLTNTWMEPTASDADDTEEAEALADAATEMAAVIREWVIAQGEDFVNSLANGYLKDHQ